MDNSSPSKDKSEYFTILNRSKTDLKTASNLVTFTMEELEAYTARNINQDNNVTSNILQDNKGKPL
jgi:hypothetical protein